MATGTIALVAFGIVVVFLDPQLPFGMHAVGAAVDGEGHLIMTHTAVGDGPGKPLQILSQQVVIGMAVRILHMGGTVASSLSMNSREGVNTMNEAAAAKGGSADINPVQDLGFMYNRALADPDGHIWEAVWMNPSAIPAEEKNR
jgi:uncharacterized glyoxalase superfamily protein PhnB